MDLGSGQKQGTEFGTGWPLIAAGFVSTFVFSLPPYTTGIFIAPLQTEFGWSRSQISLSVSIFTLGMAVGAIAVGHFVSLRNARWLVLLGVAAFALGYGAFTKLDGNVAVLWVIAAMMALIGAACSPVTVSRLLIHAFDRRRGTAVGFAMVGSGAASAVVPPILVPIVAGHGWRAGYSALAVGVTAGLVLISIVLFAIGSRKRGATIEVDQDVVAARTPSVRLGVAFFLVAAAIGGAVVHLVPALTDARFSSASIALLTGVLGVSTIASRIVTGLMVDRYDGAAVAAAVMATGGVGFGAIALGGATALPLVAVAAGWCLGAELDLLAFLTSRLSAQQRYARIYGYQFFAFQLGLAVSPLLYAALHGATSSYRLAFVLSAVLLLISSLILRTLRQVPA